MILSVINLLLFFNQLFSSPVYPSENIISTIILGNELYFSGITFPDHKILWRENNANRRRLANGDFLLFSKSPIMLPRKAILQDIDKAYEKLIIKNLFVYLKLIPDELKKDFHFSPNDIKHIKFYTWSNSNLEYSVDEIYIGNHYLFDIRISYDPEYLYWLELPRILTLEFSIHHDAFARPQADRYQWGMRIILSSGVKKVLII